MIKVSIVVPVYNVEPYLHQCMDSLINQSLREIEIICINDGSTDSSLSILQEYAALDKRVVIIDKENGGYGIGMNIGFARASGEYIGIVEPDDFVKLTMFQELYHVAHEHDLDFVKSDFYRFATKDDVTTLTYYHLSPTADDYNQLFNPSERPLALRWIMNTWCGIYKRSFIEGNNIRHNETPGASFQDNGFCFQTFAFGKKAMIIDKPYYFNRRDNPNSSVSNPQKVYCINAEYDFIRDILLKDPVLWERFRGIYWQKRYHNYTATLKRISPEFKNPYRARMKKELLWAHKRNEIREEDFYPIEWEHIVQLCYGTKKPSSVSAIGQDGPDQIISFSDLARRKAKTFRYIMREGGFKHLIHYLKEKRQILNGMRSK